MIILQIAKGRYRLQWAEEFVSKEIVQEASFQKHDFYKRHPSSVALSRAFFHLLTFCVLVVIQRAAKGRCAFQSNV